jgi:hypothetical protein
MIHAFDDREPAAASLAPAAGPEGKLALGLAAAKTNAPYR